MEQKILSLKDDKILSEVELFEYPEELEIGGRNLALGSGTERESTRYLVHRYDMSEAFVEGYYTFSLKGSVNEGQIFAIWPDTGNLRIGSLSYDSEKDAWYRTVYIHHVDHIGDDGFRVYNYQSGGATNATIKWIKLEKGTIPTDWTPAPEDLGLTYPDFITEFKPSISDRYILTEELIEGQPTSFSNKITTNEFIEQ